MNSEALVGSRFNVLVEFVEVVSASKSDPKSANLDLLNFTASTSCYVHPI